METYHYSYKQHIYHTLFTALFLLWSGLIHVYSSNIRLESNRLSVINGLSCNTVNDIQQDRDGYIWLGTTNGMSRYDGYSFVNFSKFDRDISQIMNDDKYHVMWGYSSRQILCCYDMQRAQIATYEDSNKDSKLLNNRFMSSNGIWLFSGEFGVRHLIYSKGSFHATDYTTKNGGIVGDRSLQVTEDSKQNIWISSNKGLNRITPDGKSHVILKGKDIIVMTCNGQQLAVLSKQGDAYIYNNKGQLIKKSHLASMTGFVGKSRASMFWNGSWYIFTQAETFAMDLKTGIFSKPKEQVPNAMDKNPLKSYKFFYDKEGNVFIFGKKSHLFRKFNLLQSKSIIGARDKNFVAAEDAQGRIFISSYGNGLFIYNPKDDQLQHFSAYDKEPLFHTDFLLNVFIDRIGCAWVGTASGLYQLRELTGLDYEVIKLAPANLQDEWSNTVRHISDLGNGSLAISTKVNKTYIYDLRTHQTQHIINTDACVYSYVIAPDGKAWIGTKGNGLLIDGVNFSKYQKGGYYVPTLSFYDIVFDKYGRSWMATWGDGLLLGKFDAKKQLKYQQFLSVNGNEAQIHDLVAGKNGQLWIASNNGLIMVNTFKKQISEKDFIKFNRQNGKFPANKVNCGIYSNDGSLWFGTNRGVFRCTYNEQSQQLEYQHFDTTKGLISNMVTSIVQDAYHNIWIGTEEGLTLLNTKTGDMRAIKFSSSLQENYIVENCAIRLKDGRLAFGAASGVVLIKPHKVRLSKEPDMKVTITDMTINGISVYDEQVENILENALDYTQSISLPHDKNSLSIYFSNFDYPNIKSTMYQFYLEGIDDAWRPATSINHADFSELNPGHYTLHLRTLLGNNQWSQETKLKITIEEPWYNSWWAWIIYLLIIGSVSYLFYRSWRRNFDLNQQIKMEKEMSNFRIEFFTHISHEFRTPLAIIQSAVEKISNSENGHNKNTLLTLQRGNKRLQRLINQLMEFRKANTGNMKLALEENDIVSFTRNIFNDIRQVAVQKGINISFTPWTSSYRMYFDPEKVETIIYNLLSNAVKYTPDKGAIEVNLSLNETGLQLTVEDSGPGIKPEREHDLFKPFMHGNVSKGGMGIGLYNAYEMAILHKGSITYQRSSRKEQALGGSLFTLQLPTNKEVYQPEDFTQHVAIDQDSMNKEEIDMLVKEMTPEAINQIKVMVIEDDPDMMEQIKSELATYFQVVAFMNGKAGFDNIKKVKPSLLISDIMLPGMSGYEIVSNMKADPETQNIPVIMLTAFDDTNHILKAYKNFVDDYMVKPCNFKLLIARALQFVTMDIKAKEFSEKKQEATVTPTAAPTEEKKDIVMTSVLDKKFKDKLEFIIAQHIGDQDFNVDRLAESLNIGRTTLYSRAKVVLGVSPSIYIQNERLRIAASMLLEGQYTIAEISDKVGFSDTTYFYKCFKNKYGVAPSKYGK